MVSTRTQSNWTATSHMDGEGVGQPTRLTVWNGLPTIGRKLHHSWVIQIIYLVVHESSYDLG